MGQIQSVIVEIFNVIGKIQNQFDVICVDLLRFLMQSEFKGIILLLDLQWGKNETEAK